MWNFFSYRWFYCRLVATGKQKDNQNYGNQDITSFHDNTGLRLKENKNNKMKLQKVFKSGSKIKN
jgi:hypothetical protein